MGKLQPAGRIQPAGPYILAHRHKLKLPQWTEQKIFFVSLKIMDGSDFQKN